MNNTKAEKLKGMRFEVTKWHGSTDQPKAILYGIRCRRGRGKWMDCGVKGNLLLFGTHNEANETRLKLIAMQSMTLCGILGCGNSYPAENMRDYDLAGSPTPCCPECWDYMHEPNPDGLDPQEALAILNED